ncbi:TIGR03915 family putative DNA repair protein [Bacteroidota bacterium]
MNIYLYDKTFGGFLTIIHHSFEMKLIPDKILDESNYQNDLFSNTIRIITDPKKAQQVWNVIRKKSSRATVQIIYKTFLSELPEIEMLLFNYIKLIIDTPHNVEMDYANDDVLKVNKIHTKVVREAHKALMFIRFQKTSDHIYYASFEPKYNVLPFAIEHFKDRFSDQKWILYDTKRKYGFYFDGEEVREFQFTHINFNETANKLDGHLLSDDELLYQDLWKTYYHSVNIKERKNMKVHIQFMPKRFWKYLPEKDLTAIDSGI